MKEHESKISESERKEGSSSEQQQMNHPTTCLFFKKKNIQLRVALHISIIVALTYLEQTTSTLNLHLSPAKTEN
jgi:hypothetical protein